MPRATVMVVTNNVGKDRQLRRPATAPSITVYVVADLIFNACARMTHAQVCTLYACNG